MTACSGRSLSYRSRLKCTRCHKWKGTTNYSNKQLADLRYKIFTHGHAATEDGSGIKCRVCTGQQIVEMHCYMCNRTKGLDEFAKAQRSDPDHAVAIAQVPVDAFE